MNSLFTRVCPALIIALALSACGSSGQTPSTSPTTTVPENGSKPAESKPVEPSGNTTADNKPAELSQNTSSENKENTTAETKPQSDDKPTTPPVIIPPTTPTQPAEPSDNTTADNKPAEPPQNTSSENKENTTAENKPQPNDKPITPPVVIPPATPTQPTENTSKEISSIAVEYDEPRTYEVPPYRDYYGTGPREIGKSDNLYTLVVDGEKIKLFPDSAVLGGEINTTDSNEYGQVIRKTVMTDLKYAVHGEYYYPTAKGCESGDEDCHNLEMQLRESGRDPAEHKHLHFVQGYATKDMPLSGSAVYEGSGHKFWADFGEKTLKGDIGGEFTAKITGNTFATDNSSTPFSPDMLEVKGGFYGPAAAEIAGVYYDHEHSAGTFGAKKVQATPAPTVQP